ncbi:MAG: 30S ribosomal protein S3 [Thermoplasmata archaeon]|jgi:small subunit ribosomal protein S3|nr:30S ribosomal protein S3 [Thermoplasmata archaeon]MVT13796.1 30S ribosomal protein S3 [Euryarchaeota archaeon]MVT15201.1 30S ribosomal protein S3 [Euryarchaeota archaeon]MVT35691.1 30S ribosomal protein S3 [Euryarchaeota archaeon]
MDEKKFVQENVKRLLLKEYVKKFADNAGFGGLEIQRTPMGTRIVLQVEKPGLIIGKKGTKIKDLTDIMTTKFKIENPQIEVKDDPNPSLNAQIMAKKLAVALETGWHFRRAAHSTIKRIMDAGAKGAQVIISGKLGGDRAKREKITAGKIKYSGKPREQVRVGFAVAMTKPGIIGVTVKILPPDAKLPDEITIIEPKEEVKNEGDQGEGPKEPVQ